VGNGPEKNNLVNQAKGLGLDDKVIFTGTLSKEEMALAYNSAHIFVFASVTETQGLVVGEAKAAGLPVVAVKAFGISEMVEDNVDGFLTDLDINEFTQKISLLLQDGQLLATLGQNAIRNAEKISSYNCANMLIQCYNETIKNYKKDIKLITKEFG